MSTLEDLEARVAALEANQADYRAVLAAVNALGANQRDHAGRLDQVETKVDQIASKSDDTNARVRSLEEGQAEIKDLLVRALDR
ncbi:MAG: hypothetical protein K0U76_00755 [Actinomycetia bacterium]|nr:hypothetical protein [Actinomycetes bacterium]MCH9699913.1 hypothetical protein [Actinomycetes bacterium]MCH9762096.1 hypothetical protein [Actinomycetes bacterium]